MKKLSDDDILKWLKSDEKANFIDKEKFMEKKVFPKPNQITRDTLRKILKGKIKIDAEIFPNTPPESFWTSEKNPWQPQFMWTVNFFTGHTFGRFPGFIPNYVRLVRDR